MYFCFIYTHCRNGVEIENTKKRVTNLQVFFSNILMVEVETILNQIRHCKLKKKFKFKVQYCLKYCMPQYKY